MGNAITCAFPNDAAGAAADAASVVKLVHSNGLVEEFYRPVMVGELTPDYPHHFICHLQTLLPAVAVASSSSTSPTDPFIPPPSLPLSDDFPMQLGQIYFILPLHPPLSCPAIAALLSKASFASRKESYRDIHVVSLSDYRLDVADNGGAVPVSHDFVKQLLREARLQLPTSMSGPFLISPLQQQQQQQRVIDSAASTSSCSGGRFSNRDVWRPPLETIAEEGTLSVYQY